MTRPLTIYTREAGGYLLDSDGNPLTDSDGNRLWEAGDVIVLPEMANVDQIKYATQYPGGLYGAASFFVYARTERNLSLATGTEIIIRDGPRIVWEGFADSIDSEEGGARVECIGYWGAYFENRGIDRRWSDNRISRDVMRVTPDSMGSAYHKSVVRNRNNGEPNLRIHLSDQSFPWALNDVYSLEYSMPSGETIGRIVTDWDFFEPAGQQWGQRIYDYTNSTVPFLKIATSSGSTTITFSDSRLVQTLNFELISFFSGNQTPSDTVQCDFENLFLYATRSHPSATLGNVSAYEVTLDVMHELTSHISTDLDKVSSGLSLSVEPFFTKGWETFSKVIARIAAYGDSSQNSIGFGLRRSELASDNLPVMFLETYPALTDHEYEVTVEDGDVQVRENTDEVWNSISVKYTDAVNAPQVVTPTDDATLENIESIGTYGLREKVISIKDTNTQTDAIAYGTRYLARYKDPTWSVTAPIRVKELRTKEGGVIPASQIEAGKRLRVVDLPDRPNAGTLGVNFVIVGTTYDNEADECALSVGGTPDDLSVYLAQLSIGE